MLTWKGYLRRGIGITAILIFFVLLAFVLRKYDPTRRRIRKIKKLEKRVEKLKKEKACLP